jgi:hypothetical protein
MKQVPLSQCHLVSKHACGFCTVGRVLKRCGKQSHDRCPCCGESENASHVLLCQDTRAKAKWQHDVTVLNSWMLGNNTSPAIRIAVIQNLRRWKRQLAPKTTALSHTLSSALASQRDIGWNNFIMGRLSEQWAPIQHTYFHGKKTTGCSWAASLIVHLWQLA